MQTRKVTLILLFLILISTLVNFRVFIYETLIAYILFTIFGASLIAMAGIILFKSLKISHIINPPVILMMTWIIYLLFHSMLVNNGLNLRYTFLIMSGLVFISSAIIFSSIDFDFIHLYRGLLILVIMESIICIAQYYSFIESKNTYFGVTGTWVNPNVTAMFFAMALPALWLIVKEDTLFWKRVALAAIVLCVLSIALLNCRTAIIGGVIGTIIVVSNYDIIQSLLKRTGKIIKGVALIATVCMVIISGLYLYQSKQASSEGRQLIWKISMRMIQEHPVTGYGYGLFERNYNLAQAEYFKEGSATEKEIFNSGHVRMAYNEILENTIEGGISGLLLFLGFLLSLIYYYLKDGTGATNIPQNDKDAKKGKTDAIRLNPIKNVSHLTVAFAGVIVFGIMSLINFTIQAIPCMAVFLVYAGIVAAKKSLGKKQLFIKSALQNRETEFSLTVGLILLGISITVFVSQMRYSNAHFQLKRAMIKYSNNDIYGSLHIYKKLDKEMERSEGYFKEYAKLLMK